MKNAELLAECREAPELFPALETALGQAVGHKLFTLMAVDWTSNEAARIYSSHPETYPVGGRKPFGALTNWGEIVLKKRHPWIGYTADDIRGAFFDHALIAKLGCAACLNVPVVDENTADGPRVIGTINLLHEAGYYTPGQIDIVSPFAALLLDPLRAWTGISG